MIPISLERQILEGTPEHTPVHFTIARFVSSMKREIIPLLGDILMICEEMELLCGTHFSPDGLRLPSNTSKEWSGTFAKRQPGKL